MHGQRNGEGAAAEERRGVETLGEADLARKARIPLFAPILGTDEVPLPVFVGARFDRHWAGHALQLAKIRRAAGLPEAKYTTPTSGETR